MAFLLFFAFKAEYHKAEIFTRKVEVCMHLGKISRFVLNIVHKATSVNEEEWLSISTREAR